MIFVGDIHGKIDQLNKIANRYPNDEVIQLGDFGYGFGCAFDTDPDEIARNVRFLKGNHDSPALCRKSPYYLGDFGIYKGMFFVSGAKSVDKDQRIPEVSWWYEEELSKNQWDGVLEFYEKTKPSIVLSHDCPRSICELAFGHKDHSNTRNGLQAMLDIHTPKTWIFGHHHKSFVRNINNCVFRCLPECAYFKLE